MNQKKLLAASVAAACLAMTTSALAADYSNHTGTADGTTLAGHLNSTTDAIISTNDTFENNKLTFNATNGQTTAAGIAAFHPENRGIYTQSDSPKKSSRNIWSLAVVSVDQRY